MEPTAIVEADRLFIGPQGRIMLSGQLQRIPAAMPCPRRLGCKLKGDSKVVERFTKGTIRKSVLALLNVV